MRDHVDILENRWVVVGISFGYADIEPPIIAFRTSRASADQAATLLG